MRTSVLMRLLPCLAALSVAASAIAQNSQSLPPAPIASLSTSAAPPPLLAQAAAPPMAAGQSAAVPSGTVRLTRAQAEQIALKNNPRISVAQLLALAQHQVVRETRSAEMPDLSGNATIVGANEASRVSSGSLTASRLLRHAGLGVQLSQLITDFGRTGNLVSSSKFQEKAAQASAEATRQQIILAVDYAFYSVLEAQATLRVAQQTVDARQTLTDQVTQLTKSKLRSTLDLSFAQVNLSQAKLLELDAQSSLDSDMAALTAVLGSDANTRYELVETTKQLPLPPPDEDRLVALAMQQRPDLQSLDYNHQAAMKYARAQREQLLPSISALGIVGKTPIGSSQYFNSDWYGAAGANLNIPIFNGFRYSAEANQADYQAKAAAERVRDLRDVITRDVRTSWLQASTAFQRVTVTQELLHEASLGLDLAQTRYQLGLSSIVELSQAQLQQTQAAISDANARYRYKFALSTLNFQIGRHP